jgi:cyclase
MGTLPPYTTGLHRMTEGTYAYMQPDGSWGLNNAMLLVSRGESLLVDVLCDLPHTRTMLQAIAKDVPEAKKISKVLLTHWHCDHTFGASVDELQDSTIVASRICADYLATNPPGAWLAAQAELRGDALKQHEKWTKGRFDFTGVKYRPVDETFDGETELTIGDRKVIVVESKPCHTRSDSIVFVPDEGVAHTGDLVMGKRHVSMQYPFISNLIDAVKVLVSWSAEIYLTGHGPAMNLAQMKQFLEYTYFLQDKVKGYYQAGMTVEDATDDLLRNLGPYRSWTSPHGIYFTIQMGYHELAGDKDIFWRRNNPEFIATVWRVGEMLPKKHKELFAQF